MPLAIQKLIKLQKYKFKAIGICTKHQNELHKEDAGRGFKKLYTDEQNN